MTLPSARYEPWGQPPPSSGVQAWPGWSDQHRKQNQNPSAGTRMVPTVVAAVMSAVGILLAAGVALWLAASGRPLAGWLPLAIATGVLLVPTQAWTIYLSVSARTTGRARLPKVARTGFAAVEAVAFVTFAIGLDRSYVGNHQPCPAGAIDCSGASHLIGRTVAERTSFEMALAAAAAMMFLTVLRTCVVEVSRQRDTQRQANTGCS